VNEGDEEQREKDAKRKQVAAGGKERRGILLWE